MTKSIRTAGYLGFSASVGGTTYQVSRDPIVVPDTVAAQLATAGQTASPPIATIVDVYPPAVGSQLSAVEAAKAAALAAAAVATEAVDEAVAAVAQAQTALAAALAVGNTNDGIIAGRLNEPTSAAVAALSKIAVRPAVTPAGGAAAARALLVNVRDFGARSDAETFNYDSTTAIQAAIDYCWSHGGGIVTIPSHTDPAHPTLPNRNSTFRVSQLVMREGVHLTGAGPTMLGSTLIGTASVDMIRFDRDNSQLPGNNYVLPCAISNLRLYGFPGATAGGGIVTKDATDGTLLSLQHGVTIHHVVAMNMAEDGFTIYGGSGVSDVGQIFGFLNGGYGIHLKGGTVQAVNAVDWWADGNHAGAGVCIENTIDGYAINIVGLKSEQIENPLRGIPGTPSQPHALELKNCAGKVNINGMQHISSSNNTERPGDAIIVTGAARPKSIQSAGHDVRTLITQVNGPMPELLRDTVGGANFTVPVSAAMFVRGTQHVDLSATSAVTLPGPRTWTANTAYLPGERVILPTRGLGYVTAARTSRGSWDATERDAWTFLAGGHQETLLTGTAAWKAPVGITRISTLDLLGGGAGGGGGGTATGAVNQVGGAGGAAGERVIVRNIAVTATTSYVCTIGAGGAGGAGGAAAGNNPGVVGVKGGETNVTVAGTVYRAGGGNVGTASGAASTTSVPVGPAGGNQTSVSAVGVPGTGGVAGSTFAQAPAPLAGVIGGSGGGPAASGTLKGGVGGGARTTVGGNPFGVAPGGSATSDGTVGVTATELGCGGGGGGGGNNGGAGGAGGAGAAGSIVVEF